MFTSLRSNRGTASMLRGVTVRRGLAWGIMILGALLAFEVFNYSTTQFALADVLGNLTFAGISWATILAIAFCGIDFAGIARLFTPQQGRDEPAEVWYLFGAWLLAAAMNATLTWWGVSVAITNHTSLSSGTVISTTTLTKVVPVFVAVMVWLIRVLIIGTFSVAGDRLFSQEEAGQSHSGAINQPMTTSAARPRPSISAPFRPSPKTAQSSYAHPEPTYQNLSLGARPAREAEYSDTPRRS